MEGVPRWALHPQGHGHLDPHLSPQEPEPRPRPTPAAPPTHSIRPEKSKAGSAHCSIPGLPFPSCDRNFCRGWAGGLGAGRVGGLPFCIPCTRMCCRRGLLPQGRCWPGCSGEARVQRQEGARGTGKPGLLLGMFLGPECHPLEAWSHRDAAGSERAVANRGGLWRQGWGLSDSHMPSARALCGGFPQAFIITRAHRCPPAHGVPALGRRNQSGCYDSLRQGQPGVQRPPLGSRAVNTQAD